MADDRYLVNLFRPRSKHARHNMKMIFFMLAIWACAVFGFQFLLIALQEPTPEPTLNDFKEVWTEVENDSASKLEQQRFARSLLMVLGKNIVVTDPHKAILSDALNTSIYNLAAGNTSGLDADRAAALIGLKNQGFDPLLKDLLSFYLKDDPSPVLSEQTKKELPGIMELYLVHNQSVLTDTRFLGFPFHYWYTAQFLLILFVFLCLIYAKLVDNANEKFNFVEED